ncbi:hypothetical protein EDB87DRAFT_1574937 [Lactarius vividus]|nr:hypothetical protein EDB87DRAFT_1574937 [Lactarius vividus]
MSLTIILGDLYSSRRHEGTREVVKAHIWAHFVSDEQLAHDGVEVANVRPTGWHRERGRGAVEPGWHLTVDFKRRNGVHVTTHHVYHSDPAFNGVNGQERAAPSHDSLGKAETRRPHHLPCHRSHRCLATTLPSPPPTSPSSPLHRVTIAVMIVAQVVLAECLGASSGILMGVVAHMPMDPRPHHYDEGCLVDSEGWHSVTPEAIVTQIVELRRCDVVLDAPCGVGDKPIAFA